MFNIGFTEFLAIGVVALLVIGPKQLPEVAKVVGRLLSELKKATQDLSGGLLEVTQEVKESIDETHTELVSEGKKIVDNFKDEIKISSTETVEKTSPEPQTLSDKLTGKNDG